MTMADKEACKVKRSMLFPHFIRLGLLERLVSCNWKRVICEVNIVGVSYVLSGFVWMFKIITCPIYDENACFFNYYYFYFALKVIWCGSDRISPLLSFCWKGMTGYCFPLDCDGSVRCSFHTWSKQVLCCSARSCTISSWKQRRRITL